MTPDQLLKELKASPDWERLGKPTQALLSALVKAAKPVKKPVKK